MKKLLILIGFLAINGNTLSSIILIKQYQEERNIKILNSDYEKNNDPIFKKVEFLKSKLIVARRRIKKAVEELNRVKKANEVALEKYDKLIPKVHPLNEKITDKIKESSSKFNKVGLELDVTNQELKLAAQKLKKEKFEFKVTKRKLNEAQQEAEIAKKQIKKIEEENKLIPRVIPLGKQSTDIINVIKKSASAWDEGTDNFEINEPKVAELKVSKSKPTFIKPKPTFIKPKQVFVKSTSSKRIRLTIGKGKDSGGSGPSGSTKGTISIAHTRNMERRKNNFMDDEVKLKNVVITNIILELENNFKIMEDKIINIKREYENNLIEINQRILEIQHEFAVAEDNYKNAKNETAKQDFIKLKQNFEKILEKFKILNKDLEKVKSNFEKADKNLKKVEQDITNAKKKYYILNTKEAEENLEKVEQDFEKAEQDFEKAEQDFIKIKEERKEADKNFEVTEMELLIAEKKYNKTTSLEKLANDIKIKKMQTLKTKMEYKKSEYNLEEKNDQLEKAQNNLKIAEQNFEKMLTNNIIKDSNNIVKDKLEKLPVAYSSDKLKLTLTVKTWQKIIILFRLNSKQNFLNKITNMIKNFWKSNKDSSGNLVTNADINSFSRLIWEHFSYYNGVFSELDISQAVVITSFSGYPDGYWYKEDPSFFTDVIGQKMPLSEEEEIQVAQSELQEAENDFEIAEEKLLESKTKFLLQKIQYKILALEQEFTIIKDKLVSIETEFKGSKLEYKKLKDELEESKLEYKELEKAYDDAQQNFQFIEQNFTTKNTTLDEMASIEAKWNEAQLKYKEIEESLEESKEIFQKLIIKLSESQVLTNELKEEIRIVQNRITELNNDLNVAKNKILEIEEEKIKILKNNIIKNWNSSSKVDTLEKWYKFLAYDELKLVIIPKTWWEIDTLYWNNTKNDFLNKLENKIRNFHKDTTGWEEPANDSDIKSLAYLIWDHFSYYYNLFLNLDENQVVSITSYAGYPHGYWDSENPSKYNKILGQKQPKKVINDWIKKEATKLEGELNKISLEKKTMEEKIIEKIRKFEETKTKFLEKILVYEIKIIKIEIKIIKIKLKDEKVLNDNDEKTNYELLVAELDMLEAKLESKKAEEEINKLIQFFNIVKNNLEDKRHSFENNEFEFNKILEEISHIDTIEKWYVFLDSGKLKLLLTAKTWQEINLLFQTYKKNDFLNKLENKINNFNKKINETWSEAIKSDVVSSYAYLIWDHFSYYRELFLNLDISQAVVITSFSGYPHGYWYKEDPSYYNDVVGKKLPPKLLELNLEKAAIKDIIEKFKDRILVVKEKIFAKETEFIEKRIKFLLKKLDYETLLLQSDEKLVVTRAELTQLQLEYNKTKEKKEILTSDLAKLEDKFIKATNKLNKKLILLSEKDLIEKWYKFLAHDELKLVISYKTWREITALYWSNTKNDFLSKLENKINTFYKKTYSKWEVTIDNSDISSLAYLIWDHFSYYYNLFLNLYETQAVSITSYTGYSHGYWNNSDPSIYNKVIGEKIIIPEEEDEVKEVQDSLEIIQNRLMTENKIEENLNKDFFKKALDYEIDLINLQFEGIK